MANLEYCLSKPFRFPYAENEPKNRFEYIAEALLADLLDRRGIKSELEACDAEVRSDIVQSLANIVAEIFGKELPDPEPKWWRDV